MSQLRVSMVAVGIVGLLFTATPSRALCPPSCPIPGGGDPVTDCHTEFAAEALRLNFPPFDPEAPAPVPAVEVRCFDGGAGCDLDGRTDRACVFDIDVCVRNDDPNLSDCAVDDVTAIEVVGAADDPELQALQDALDALLPATEPGAARCPCRDCGRTSRRARDGVMRPIAYAFSFPSSIRRSRSAPARR